MKTAIPLKQVIAGFSPARKKRINGRAKELIAEEMALRDIRKSRALTQEQVAKRLGGKQVYVSRLESRSDVKVSTLRDYVHAQTQNTVMARFRRATHDWWENFFGRSKLIGFL